MFSGLPSCGRPSRLMMYDLHTLQNRHYVHGNCIASLQSTIPVLIQSLKGSTVNCVAFPDDGAKKRFAFLFEVRVTYISFRYAVKLTSFSGGWFRDNNLWENEARRRKRCCYTGINSLLITKSIMPS